MKVLICGWFSFEQMGATAGDLMVRDLVAGWLDRHGVDYDTALAHPFQGGVKWSACQAGEYSHVVFLCGPFGNGAPLVEFLDHFKECRLFGLDVSMLDSLNTWNPFDFLIERDSDRATHPDLAFMAHTQAIPLVGVVLVEPQKEYRERAMHQVANDAIEHLLKNKVVCRIPIDTRLDENKTGFQSAGEIESIISRMDAVVTTRLHGMVLALKHGVPALAIDPISGGAKIRKQAETIGWPLVTTADAIDNAELSHSFQLCLTSEYREMAIRCRDKACGLLEGIEEQIIAALKHHQ